MQDIINGKYGRLYVTGYIFDEIVTVIFIRLKNLSKTVKIGEIIKKSTELLEVERPDFENAWEFFKKQKMTTFSFTDCTTLEIMKRKDINNIATFDKDFKKIKEVNVIE